MCSPDLGRFAILSDWIRSDFAVQLAVTINVFAILELFLENVCVCVFDIDVWLRSGAAWMHMGVYGCVMEEHECIWMNVDDIIVPHNTSMMSMYIYIYICIGATKPHLR